MIARATLALMLAYPTAAIVLGCPQLAHAHDRKLPPPESSTSGKREKGAGSRRLRALAQSLVHRRDAPAVSATFDDGLAYDTPRGPDGRPVALTLGAHPIALATEPFQTGLASWYGGKRWQGRMTSSGSRYDEQALTAAHATLPLGSQVRVRLVHSDREVVVTITDRPGTRRRIIDLSRGAAAALGILSQGVAEVALQPL
jgi:rare lipoprotein A (peptidoglycan hydrolase)